jgi:hypothetical protein
MWGTFYTPAVRVRTAKKQYINVYHIKILVITETAYNLKKNKCFSLLIISYEIGFSSDECRIHYIEIRTDGHQLLLYLNITLREECWIDFCMQLIKSGITR